MNSFAKRMNVGCCITWSFLLHPPHPLDCYLAMNLAVLAPNIVGVDVQTLASSLPPVDINALPPKKKAEIQDAIFALNDAKDWLLSNAQQAEDLYKKAREEIGLKYQPKGFANLGPKLAELSKKVDAIRARAQATLQTKLNRIKRLELQLTKRQAGAVKSGNVAWHHSVAHTAAKGISLLSDFNEQMKVYRASVRKLADLAFVEPSMALESGIKTNEAKFISALGTQYLEYDKKGKTNPKYDRTMRRSGAYGIETLNPAYPPDFSTRRVFGRRRATAQYVPKAMRTSQPKKRVPPRWISAPKYRIDPSTYLLSNAPAPYKDARGNWVLPPGNGGGGGFGGGGGMSASPMAASVSMAAPSRPPSPPPRPPAAQSFSRLPSNTMDMFASRSTTRPMSGAKTLRFSSLGEMAKRQMKKSIRQRSSARTQLLSASRNPDDDANIPPSGNLYPRVTAFGKDFLNWYLNEWQMVAADVVQEFPSVLSQDPGIDRLEWAADQFLEWASTTPVPSMPQFVVLNVIVAFLEDIERATGTRHEITEFIFGAPGIIRSLTDYNARTGTPYSLATVDGAAQMANIQALARDMFNSLKAMQTMAQSSP